MRVGSLFSGIGGLDLAVEAVLGAEPAWFVEYEVAPSTVLERHWPGVPNMGDVTAVDWTAVESVDVLTAGYPCQPFSHAGQRKGSADVRHLWPYVADAVRHLRPGRVVLENVAAHLSMGFGRVVADLAGMGYVGRWGVVRACDAGLPHRRARIFVVATDADGTGFDRGTEPDIGPATGLEASQRRDTDRRRLDTPRRDPAAAWGPYAAAVERWERLSGQPAPHPLDGTRLNPSFVRWMMGFPPGWVDGMKRNQALKALGNAVAPPQGILALSLLLGVPADGTTASGQLLPTPTSRDHKGPNQRGDTSCLHGALMPTPHGSDR